MRLPRYLVVAMIVTSGLVLWAQFSSEQDQSEQGMKLTSPSIAPGVAPVPVTDEQTPAIDLFPVPFRQAPQPEEQKKGAMDQKTVPPFPLPVVGAWWQGNDRIVILSDGQTNTLLCAGCQRPGYIGPGELITPEWKFKAMADDAISVEWLPENMTQRIDLGDLKSKPAQ